MADTYPKNTIDDNGLKKVWDMAMAEVDLKVDKEAGKGLSTNDYTTTEKNKLEGIESGAEVNTVTSVAGKTGAVTLDKSDVGLSNVGNFKAVSTSANQGLTDTEKSNARANIDTPSNGDIQSSKTLKSSVVTVADAAPINAEDITVDITPVQLGSGTPSPDNIRPIEGRTGAELDRVGKNLFDGFWESGIIDTNTGEDMPMNGVVRTGYVGIEGVDIYTMSNYNYGNVNNFFVVLCYDQNKAYLGQVSVTVFDRTASQENEKFTVLNGTKYVRFYISSATLGNESTQYLHRGETALPYEPYQGQQYTASFGETVYGGKWHVTEGGTDKTLKKVEYNGSEYWQAGTALTNVYRMAANIDGVPSAENISSYLPNISDYALDEPHFYIYNGKLYVFLLGVTSDAEFATYLAQHPLQVCYELATPTTISTPKQNVPMLKGINTVYADCGDTSLKYQPDNVIGELKGEIDDNIIYEDFKWTTNSSQSYSAGTPGTYGTSSWRDVKKEGYDVIGVTFVENRRFGDCILTLYYVPSTNHVEVIIFRATSSAVTIADEDIEYRVAYKKRT